MERAHACIATTRISDPADDKRTRLTLPRWLRSGLNAMIDDEKRRQNRKRGSNLRNFSHRAQDGPRISKCQDAEKLPNTRLRRQPIELFRVDFLDLMHRNLQLL